MSWQNWLIIITSWTGLIFFISKIRKAPTSLDFENTPEALIMETTNVVTRVVENKNIYTGQVCPKNYAELRFSITGEIDEIIKDDNAFVKKGEIIAKLRDTNGLTASAKAAEENLAKEKLQLSIIEKMHADGGASELELQAQKANCQIAYYEHLRRMTEIEKIYLRAPFDGVLGLFAANLRKGAYFTGEKPLVDIFEQGDVFIDISVPEWTLKEFLKLQGVQGLNEIKVLVEDTNSTFVSKGKIVGMGFRADKVHGSFLRAVVENEFILLPNEFVKVQITYGQRHILAVPTSAISMHENKNYYVYLIIDGKAVLTEVLTGGEFDGFMSIITSNNIGIKDGDEIVLDGSALIDGMQIISLGGVHENS